MHRRSSIDIDADRQQVNIYGESISKVAAAGTTCKRVQRCADIFASVGQFVLYVPLFGAAGDSRTSQSWYAIQYKTIQVQLFTIYNLQFTAQQFRAIWIK